MKFDFHMHSVFSDGSSTVEEIFDIAKKNAYSGIAITDHDTVLGLEKADELSKKYNIPFIPATEFTAYEHGMKFHVLGYGIDYKSEELIDYSTNMLNQLNDKSKKQIKLMHNNGIEIKEEEFLKEGQGGPLYRAKFLKVLSRHGYLKEEDIMNSLDKYFGKGSPYYVEDGFHFKSFKEVVDLIRRNNGKVVLAHPAEIKNRNEDLYWEILNSKGLLDGLEVYHISNDTGVRKELIDIAKREELIITGGSDYHGDYNKDKTPIGGIDLPMEVFNNLSPYLLQKHP